MQKAQHANCSNGMHSKLFKYRGNGNGQKEVGWMVSGVEMNSRKGKNCEEQMEETVWD